MMDHFCSACGDAIAVDSAQVSRATNQLLLRMKELKIIRERNAQTKKDVERSMMSSTTAALSTSSKLEQSSCASMNDEWKARLLQEKINIIRIENAQNEQLLKEKQAQRDQYVDELQILFGDCTRREELKATLKVLHRDLRLRSIEVGTLLRMRRLQRVNELFKMLPIIPSIPVAYQLASDRQRASKAGGAGLHLSGCSTILGIPLQNNGYYFGAPVDAVATALGHIAHLIDAISTTMNMPLLHPITTIMRYTPPPPTYTSGQDILSVSANASKERADTVLIASAGGGEGITPQYNMTTSYSLNPLHKSRIGSESSCGSSSSDIERENATKNRLFKTDDYNVREKHSSFNWLAVNQMISGNRSSDNGENGGGYFIQSSRRSGMRGTTGDSGIGVGEGKNSVNPRSIAAKQQQQQQSPVSEETQSSRVSVDGFDYEVNKAFTQAVTLLRANVVSLCIRMGLNPAVMWPQEALLLNLHELRVFVQEFITSHNEIEDYSSNALKSSTPWQHQPLPLPLDVLAAVTVTEQKHDFNNRAAAAAAVATATAKQSEGGSDTSQEKGENQEEVKEEEEEEEEESSKSDLIMSEQTVQRLLESKSQEVLRPLRFKYRQAVIDMRAMVAANEEIYLQQQQQQQQHKQQQHKQQQQYQQQYQQQQQRQGLNNAEVVAAGSLSYASVQSRHDRHSNQQEGKGGDGRGGKHRGVGGGALLFAEEEEEDDEEEWEAVRSQSQSQSAAGGGEGYMTYGGGIVRDNGRKLLYKLQDKYSEAAAMSASAFAAATSRKEEEEAAAAYDTGTTTAAAAAAAASKAGSIAASAALAAAAAFRDWAATAPSALAHKTGGLLGVGGGGGMTADNYSNNVTLGGWGSDPLSSATTLDSVHPITAGAGARAAVGDVGFSRNLSTSGITDINNNNSTGMSSSSQYNNNNNNYYNNSHTLNSRRANFSRVGNDYEDEDDEDGENVDEWEYT